MKNICLLFLLFVSYISNAQIYGIVKDARGEALPYASIYVKGTSKGTTSNLQGQYKLDLQPGNYEMVFQYIGLETKIVNIGLDENGKEVNVVLKSQATVLKELIVAADAEDPAYRVIRKAIEKRKYYLNLIDHFSCDVYVKGNNKILDAPEKILGVEVGDMEGLLDSNRQGIVYLSESISRLYFQKPDQLKEVVYSSKISGDDRGYSFNSAREMEFNIYENTLYFNRQLVSPISNNALSYYKYRLEGTFYDQDSRLINKIKIIPKRESDPIFYGTIYIVEDLWNVHSLELGITAQSSQLYFIDSLIVNQVFIPLKEPDTWRLFTNNFHFKASAFGFVIEGIFTGNYSNYNLNPEFAKGFFNSEVYRVEKESNKKDSIYWDEHRPTPLTDEEKVDYVKKDSIQKVKDDPAYKDSMDRKDNAPNFGNLLAGYEYKRSKHHTYWNVGSPLEHLGYNTVQGYTAGLDLGFKKYFDEDETRRILFDSYVGYGFSEEKLRAKASITYRPDRLTRSYLQVTGGTDIKQFNKFSPVDELRNTLYSVLVRQNFPKYYEYGFLKFGASREVWNGINLNFLFGYEHRSPLVNNSDFSFFYKDTRIFTINNPLIEIFDDIIGLDPFAAHEVLALDIGASIRFKQQYYVYPDRKFSGENKGPTVRLNYRILGGLGNDISMQVFKFSLDDRLTLGAYGHSDYFVEAGQILQKNNLEFIDFFHFRGNQFTLSNPNDYDNSFLMLPYYSHSTDGRFVQAHWQHNFNGFILDKIPGIREAGFSLVAGAKYLHSKGNDNYAEFHLGIDKIGWHIFRLLRFDVVMSVTGSSTDFAYRIGIKI